MHRNTKGRIKNMTGNRDRLWDIYHQRDFLDHLGKNLGFKYLEDWYQIKIEDIVKYGGRGLISKYGDSPSKLLQTIFPQFSWISWKFSKVPQGFWNFRDNQRNFLDWLGIKLNFKS